MSTATKENSTTSEDSQVPTEAPEPQSEKDAFEAFLADVADDIDDEGDFDDEAPRADEEATPAPEADTPEGAPPAEQKPEAEGTPPAAAAPETPPVEQPKEAAAERPTEQPQQPAPEAPQQQPLSQEELEQQFRASQEAAVDALSTHYAMTEEQVQLLDEDPQKLIPKLLAQVHMDVLNSAMQTMQRVFPSLYQMQTTQQSQAQKYEDDFWGAWPQLNRETHGTMATQYAAAYRRANPNATPEDVIRATGASIMVAAGIEPQAQQQAQEPAAVPQPFTPVTSQPAPPTPPQKKSQVDQMVDAFLAEDMEEDLD